MTDPIAVEDFLYNFEAEHVFAASLWDRPGIGEFLESGGYKKNALGTMMAEYTGADTVGRVQSLADGDPFKKAGDLMESGAWISFATHNSKVGNKLGLHWKYFGEEWTPARHEMVTPTDVVIERVRRYKKGFPLTREELTEAAAVFDRARFSQIGDLFMAGPFYAVKGKLAEVLSRFDLGEGGLVPIPIYKEDLTTLEEGEFFILKLGARKNSFVPEESREVEVSSTSRETGIKTWTTYAVQDGDIALRPSALEGPDLWIEERITRDIFMSDALVKALRQAHIKDDFRLKKCRIVEMAK